MENATRRMDSRWQRETGETSFSSSVLALQGLTQFPAFRLVTSNQLLLIQFARLEREPDGAVWPFGLRDTLALRLATASKNTR